MPSEWADIETLIRDLGAVCSAATITRPSDEDDVTVKRAIGQATQAVIDTLDSPDNAEGMSNARDAINTARELIARLAAEIDRARRARDRAGELGVNSRRRGGDTL